LAPRNRDRIREASYDLSARLAAPEFEWMLKKRLVTRAEYVEINPSELFAAVFGEREPLDDAIEFYRKHGFTAGKPPR
jgi:hypothetical protein